MATEFNFNSSPFSFLDSSGPSNPMMQEVPILGQQDFSAPAPQSSGRGSPGTTKNPGTMDSSSGGGSIFDKILNFGNTIGDLLKIGPDNNTTFNFREQDDNNFAPSLGRSDNLFSFNNFQPSSEDEDLFSFNNFQPEEFNFSEVTQNPNQRSVLDILNLPNEEQLRDQDFMNQGRRSSNIPLSVDETRALLQERFGAPTISAIQALPAGEGLGLRVDPQGRMISPGDDRSTFDQRSAERLARLEQRDLRPSETFTERDTRLADARTEGAERGGEMSFEEARKFVVRQENSRGEKESVSSYNARIKAFQAQQNSTINQLKEQYEQFRVQGQVLNNERISALAAKYQQTEPQRYRQVLQVAQAMRQDGFFEDDIQMAMYVIEEMGGKASDIFDPDRNQTPLFSPESTPDKGQQNITEEEYKKLKPGDSFFHQGQQYFKE